MASRLLPGRSAYRMNWLGGAVQEKAETVAKSVMLKRMRAAEEESKKRLYPNHGVETSTMKHRVHIAPGGFKWATEHIEPVAGGGPELRSKANLSPSWIGNAYILELGVGQKYAIFYHQKHDPFLRIPFDKAMRGFKSEVEREWRASFR